MEADLGDLAIFLWSCPCSPGAVWALDLCAFPGVEGAVGVDAVVEVRAELVEDGASIAKRIGGH